MSPPPIDAVFIRRAVKLADLDALRMALYHNGRDPQVAALPIAAQMDTQQRDDLREWVATWLESHAGKGEPPELSDTELRDMVEMAVGAPMGELEYSSRHEVTSFREFPWLAQWGEDRPQVPGDFLVVIVGGGFSGVTMAVQLDLLGIDYVVLERRSEHGGVWSINRYPDVRVDTISITYDLPFVKKQPWTEYFARGHEVRAYLDDTAERFGVRAKTRFGHDVTSMRFDEDRKIWTVTAQTEGGPRTIEANMVVAGAGLYALPNLPSFVGEDAYKGRIVHPSRWPEDLDLAGLKVATMGNGSTGVQLLSPIAQEAAQVTVFQRTPQWISPRDKYGEPIPPEINWLIANFPGYWNWWRFSATAPLFDTHALVSVDEEWRAAGGQVNPQSDALRQTLADYIKRETGGRQDLIEQLVPDYAPFSRRPIVDNGWYRALTRDNVALVTAPIARLTPSGIETADGAHHEADVIVCATGFQVQHYMAGIEVVGGDGDELHDRWRRGDGARAYLGMMYPGMPNFFSLYGPNSQPVSGGPAQPIWFAIWASFVGRQLMRMITEGAATVEVTQDAFDRYNSELDSAASTLVAMSDLGGFDRNYYVNQAHNRLQVNAPWYAPDYWRRCAQPDQNDFVLG